MRVRKYTRKKYKQAEDLLLRDFLQEKYSQMACDWQRWLFEQIPDLSHGPVLDLGSGSGSFWLKNAERIPNEGRILLVDLLAAMLQEARNELPTFHIYPDFIQANAENLPFKPDHFSIIIAAGLLDHVGDLTSAIHQIHRVLKPGGWLCTTTGGIDHLKELIELVRPFAPQAKLGRVSSQFTLENGCSVLSTKFSAVDRRIFSDELVFNEPDPVLSYLRSEVDLRRVLRGKTLTQFSRIVSELLQEQGRLKITIQKAAFLAQKSF